MVTLPFAGYRSRVKFYSVLDPTKVCSYISEVLAAGLLGPLFKVCLSQPPKFNKIKDWGNLNFRATADYYFFEYFSYHFYTIWVQ